MKMKITGNNDTENFFLKQLSNIADLLMDND